VDVFEQPHPSLDDGEVRALTRAIVWSIAAVAIGGLAMLGSGVAAIAHDGSSWVLLGVALLIGAVVVPVGAITLVIRAIATRPLAAEPSPRPRPSIGPESPSRAGGCGSRDLRLRAHGRAPR
jgi:hypothetical protein